MLENLLLKKKGFKAWSEKKMPKSVILKIQSLSFNRQKSLKGRLIKKEL